MVVVSLPRLRPVGGGTRAGWTSALEGVRSLRGCPTLQGTFILDLDSMIFGMPRAPFPALGIAQFPGDATAVGYLYAAPGAGALLGFRGGGRC